MATELRRLIFSHSESTMAISDYGNKNGVSFPEGKIIRARFAGSAEYEFHSMKQMKSPIQSDYNVQDTPRAITLTFFNEKTLEQKFYNLTSDFVSSALVEYCLKNKIMMPKVAEKHLDVTEFNICLDINMESFTDGDTPNQGLSLEE